MHHHTPGTSATWPSACSQTPRASFPSPRFLKTWIFPQGNCPTRRSFVPSPSMSAQHGAPRSPGLPRGWRPRPLSDAPDVRIPQRCTRRHHTGAAVRRVTAVSSKCLRCPGRARLYPSRPRFGLGRSLALPESFTPIEMSPRPLIRTPAADVNARNAGLQRRCDPFDPRWSTPLGLVWGAVFGDSDPYVSHGRAWYVCGLAEVILDSRRPLHGNRRAMS